MASDLKALVAGASGEIPVQILPVRRLVTPDIPRAGSPRPGILRRLVPFLIIVVIPTLIATIYFGGLASDQYVSETRFIVRSPQRASAGLLSGFLQSAGFLRSQDDSYSVLEFVKSRGAVDRLTQKHHLREILSRPEADFIARFPNVFSGSSDESLYKSYLGLIKIQTDSASGITKLEVRGFRAHDAQSLAFGLLEEAEALVNRLNDRAKQDALLSAQKEIDAAEDNFASVQRRLADFRRQQAVIDPDKQATSILELISRLSFDVVEKRARLYQIERQAPSSPQLPALKASITALEEQIAHQQSRIAGNGASIASSLSQYENLLLQRELSSRRVNSAFASLENARLDVQRQQLYIERIVEPNLPDHAAYPKSLLAIALTFGVALSAYFIIGSFSHYLRDHAEQR